MGEILGNFAMFEHTVDNNRLLQRNRMSNNTTYRILKYSKIQKQHEQI